MNRLSMVAALAVVGCVSSQNPERPTQSASTLALSHDDALLYAVDTDSELLAVIDTRADVTLAHVKVGAGAHLVTVATDDTIYVANRYAQSISVIRRGEWSEAARWSAGLEPVGVAVSADAKTLYVVSAVAADTAAHGTLLALDTSNGVTKWSLALGEEPRSISLIDDGHAVVTLLKAGDVQWVDLTRPEVTQASTPMFEQLNKTALETEKQSPGGVDTQHPRAMGAVVASPDGTRVHALGMLARQGPQNAWGGCAGQLLAAPSMFSFERDGTALVDDVFACQGGNDTVPRTIMVPPGANTFGTGPGPVLQGASAMAIERTNRWLFVAYQHSNNVALISSVSGGSSTNSFFGLATPVDLVIPVGRGPNGIAVRRDGKRAYVLNAFDHTVSVLGDDGQHGISRLGDITLASEVLPSDVVEGRKLFFDATDTRLSGSQLGAACATCHIDNGREDGHVWTFAEGRRQTMSLAGGRLSGTAPFHWDGALADMDVLMKHTTIDRMGGGGTDPDMARQVSAFLDALPAPINPKQLAEPTAAHDRGAIVFQKAECGTCHSGAKLTNNAFAHVGTKEEAVQNNFFGQPLPPGFPSEGVNVPSLLGLARTGPYLHDGSAVTLFDRIMQGKNDSQHGKTAQLSAAEVSDLVEFLETL